MAVRDRRPHSHQFLMARVSPSRAIVELTEQDMYFVVGAMDHRLINQELATQSVQLTSP